MRQLLLIIGLISFSSINCLNEKKAIIFDIGGVLLSSDIKKILSQCGYSLLLSYMAKDKKHPAAVITSLYSLANKHYDPPTSKLFDHYGNRLPKPFCLSFKGLKKESECLKEIIEIIDNNPSHFCSTREQLLAKKLAIVAFSPKIIKTIQTPNKDAISLLEECMKAGHEIIIFSNYAQQAFKSIYETFPFFKKIPKQNLIVSGYVKTAKPETRIFSLLMNLLKQLNISPRNAYYLDDQIENIEASKEYNIFGIHFENAEKTRKILRNEKIL